MEKKRSIRRIIMRRFILCSIGIWITLFFIELFLSLVTWNTEWDFSERVFSAAGSIQVINVILTGAWAAVTAAVYLLGVRFFGRDISRKIEEPVQRMAEGFRRVTDGDLDIALDFETETEFKEMRDSFNLMVLRLKESEEKRLEMENERMRLFSHIAHDLKTPMTTIIGYAGALADGLVEETEKQREYYRAIKAKSEQVNKLTDRLLSYSKLGTAQYKPNFASANLTELVRAVCASLFGEIEKHHMELDLDLPDKPVYGMADALEISRAVNNLLANAICHNPAGTVLMVKLSAEPGRAVIRIADNGIPIPKAIEKNLFEPFVSGDGSRRSGGGTGLGLAIVKKVMEQHNGEARVVNTPPPYTKAFVLSLPRQ